MKRLFCLGIVCLFIGACAGPTNVEQDPTSMYDQGINYDIVRIYEEGLATGGGGD